MNTDRMSNVKIQFSSFWLCLLTFMLVLCKALPKIGDTLTLSVTGFQRQKTSVSESCITLSRYLK